MGATDSTLMVSIFMAVVAGVGTLTALVAYVTQQARNLREVISAGDKHGEDFADKSRKELAANIMAAAAIQPADIEMLKRESVRRDELAAMETRAVAVSSRLELKMDRMAEHLQQIPALAARLDMLAKNANLER